MLCRPTPDHFHLSADERAEYARLERRKNDLQQTLGTLSDDVEEVRKVVHRLRELDMIALARATLHAPPTKIAPARSLELDSTSSG